MKGVGFIFWSDYNITLTNTKVFEAKGRMNEFVGGEPDYKTRRKNKQSGKKSIQFVAYHCNLN